ncbi:MAG: flagellar biosynthesis protein FlhF [Pseudomonadota bacterium]
MKIKKYFASNMRQALEMAKEEHGPDVVILSSRKVLSGVELIAAQDYDEAAYNKLSNAASRSNKTDHQAEPIDVPPIVEAKQESSREQSQLPDFWTEDSTIKQMRTEIQSLRTMLEQQMSGLAWGDIGRQHPLWANLIRHMINLDISPRLAKKLVREVPESYPFDKAWRTVLALLSYQIPLYDDKILSPGNVVQFLGSSGSGKTTTIAKLATQYALEYSNKDVLLATTDSHRVGAKEQLRNYARILGIPLRSINSRNDYLGLFEEASNGRLILIDTAGVSFRDEMFKTQLDLLNLGAGETINCLILQATESYNSLSRLIDEYHKLSISCCIPTKLDEAASLGSLLSVAIDRTLPVALVCDGQRVPEDIQLPKPHQLISGVVNRAKQNRNQLNEEHLEQIVGHFEYEASRTH